jgi:hypothetical protein
MEKFPDLEASKLKRAGNPAPLRIWLNYYQGLDQKIYAADKIRKNYSMIHYTDQKICVAYCAYIGSD